MVKTGTGSIDKSTPYRLTVFFLLLSFLVSIAFLSVRNIYDDEYSSLAYVKLSVPGIVHLANSEDVHPPGMYLLDHFAYEAVPSPRWMTVFPLLVLYAGLAVFLFSLAPRFPDTLSQVCFLLLASLHPQLLMWGNTIRWYGMWTGMALATLTVALQLASADQRPRFSYARAIVLGLLLTCLFYFNYITLVFGLALGVAMLLRYSLAQWKQFVVSIAMVSVLILPQLHAFLYVHVKGGGDQRSGLVLSLARLVEATVLSEAYLPWHPLALFAGVIFLGLLAVAAVRAIRLARSTSRFAQLREHGALSSVVLFSLGFFCLVAITGLGFKPRNALLLLPVLAPLYALIVSSLQSPKLQSLILIFYALWCGVGIEHLLRREGLAKTSMINRPEEVISYIQAASGTADCSVIVTYDNLLAFTSHNVDSRRLLELVIYQSPVYKLSNQTFSDKDCASVDIYWTESTLNGLGKNGQIGKDEMEAAEKSLPEHYEIHRFSFDPDAARKRKMTFMGSGALDVPDYRYVVASARITPQEWANLRSKLPHYVSADGVSKPLIVFPPNPKIN